MDPLEKFEEHVSSWPRVSTHPHRFAGREFRFENGEMGHMHASGMLDIPFPRSIRDALLAENLAEEHHWVPNSGWITYRVRSEAELQHALWLMRLSYLRYILKSAASPHELLEGEAEKLHLNPRLRSLFERLIRQPKQQESVDVRFA
jgi:hypothetical protein